MKRVKKAVLIVSGTIVAVILLSIGTTFVSPRPVIALLNALIFDSPPESSLPESYAEYERKVTVLSNLEYPSTYNNNTFDVYQPKDAHETTPLIVWVHGGGYIGGYKEMIENYAVSLAAQGYVVVSMNYALAPNTNYPAPVVQVDEFVRYILTKGSSFGFDDNQVFFTGDSAGAQIVSQYLLTQTTPGYGDVLQIKKTLTHQQIRGVLLYCGPYQMEDLMASDSWLVSSVVNNIGWGYFGIRNWNTLEAVEHASITNNVTQDFPAAYITDGNTGSFESSGRAFADKLTALGVPVTTRFYNKEEHITKHEYQFLMGNEAGKTTFKDTLRFLEEQKLP